MGIGHRKRYDNKRYRDINDFPPLPEVKPTPIRYRNLTFSFLSVWCLFSGAFWWRSPCFGLPLETKMEGGTEAYNSRTPEDVFRDFRGRRAGIVKALTTDVEKFYQKCDPGEFSCFRLDTLASVFDPEIGVSASFLHVAISLPTKNYGRRKKGPFSRLSL
ncbi:hypothetical protein GW17_00041502 [Ensete ventricosum]|nr:hypothetical protein GW17_00041502 [Ensete ventricosum]